MVIVASNATKKKEQNITETEITKTMLKDKFKQYTAQDKKEEDINGYWLIPDNPMTKIGVFPYLGRQISPELEPDRIYQVLRPEEELTKQETLESLKLIPLINDHTMIGTQTGMKPAEEVGVEGTTGTNVKVSGRLLTNDLKCYTENIKELISSGKKDLSMGYRCRYELTEGEFEGQHYDAIQRDIIFNHIALVDEGRMGSDVRVMDSFTFDSISALTGADDYQKGDKFRIDLPGAPRTKYRVESSSNGFVTYKNKENETRHVPVNMIKKANGIYNRDEDIKQKENKMDEEKKTQDEDKREIIREVMAIAAKPNEEFEGGEEEKIDTITKKLKALAYNPSEAGNNDEDLPDDKKNSEDEDEEKHCGDEDEEKKDDGTPTGDEYTGKSCGDEDPEGDKPAKDEDEEEKPVSMDSAIKYIAKRDGLISRLRPVIGDNANFKRMNIKEITKYACDKLDIKNSLDTLEGYLKAKSRMSRTKVSMDAAFSTEPKMSNTMREYLK